MRPASTKTMAVIYRELEIDALVKEHKSAPSDWYDQIRLRPKRGHSEQQVEIVGDRGNIFRLIFRQNQIAPLDFSIILAVRPPQSNVVFRLLRYNGKSHEHTNRIEQNRFYHFHIHKATERYHKEDQKEDGYAEPTDRYSDLRGALKCIIDDANIKIPQDSQGSLLEE